jgi:hypothetical protein
MSKTSILSRIDALTATIEKHNIGDSWTVDFLQSVRAQVVSRGTLSYRQNEILTTKEAQYSPAKIEERAAWYTAWDDEKASLFGAACAYYRQVDGGRYFSFAHTEEATNPSYIPAAGVFYKMIGNKYFKRWQKENGTVHRFAVGALVKPKASARSTYDGHGCLFAWAKLANINIVTVTQAIKEKRLMGVVVAQLPALAAAKGAKRYQVAPIGSLETIIVEERWLSARGVK